MNKIIKKYNIYIYIYILIITSYVLITCKNESIRHEVGRYVSNQYQKIQHPVLVFCGDSLTYHGGLWMKVDAFIFRKMNLGQSGSTIDQILFQVDEAIQYHPQFISILAGTNDLSHDQTSYEERIKDWSKIWKTVDNHQDIVFIVQTVPQWKTHQFSSEIEALDQVIVNEATKRKNVRLIDLKTLLSAVQNQSSLFIDHVHFSDKAYEVWSQKINEVLQAH